jgi:hypothetical protein
MVPGAENYVRYFDEQSLVDMSFIDPSVGLAATGDVAVFNRLFRYYADQYDEMDKLDFTEKLRNLQNGETYSHPPRFTASWDEATGDIMVKADIEALDQIEAMRMAGDNSKGKVPVEFRWSEAGGNPFLNEGDWQHSGRVVFTDESGKVIHKSSWRDFDFPFAEDFKARRNPELEGQWWSEAPINPWAFDSGRAMKYQAVTDAEVESMMKRMYSVTAPSLYDELRLGGGLQEAGTAILDWAIRNNVDVPINERNKLKNGDSDAVTGWLLGERDVRFAGDTIKDALKHTKLSGYLDDRALNRTLKVAEQETKNAGVFGSAIYPRQMDEVQYFNGVMDTMQREDPARYQQLLDFVADSPYRQSAYDFPGTVAERPMLIFHSGKYYDMEGMGYGDVELPQMLWPRELGVHGGDIEQSSGFASTVFYVRPEPKGKGSYLMRPDPQVPDDKVRRLRANETESNWIRSNMPEAALDEYRAVRRQVLQRTLNRLVEDPSTGRMSKVNPADEILKAMYESRGLSYPDGLVSADDYIEFGEVLGLDMTRARELNTELEAAYKTPGPRTKAEIASDLRRETKLPMEMHGAVRALESETYDLVGKTMYPLVFRGRRPFRMRDVVGNTHTAQAKEALNWQGWNDTQRANLQMIAENKVGTHREQVDLFRKTMEDAGFDHIIYMNTGEGVGRPSIIFWDQSLAKPLYGSRGFDRNSDKWVNSVLASPLFGLDGEGDDDD